MMSCAISRMSSNEGNGDHRKIPLATVWISCLLFPFLHGWRRPRDAMSIGHDALCKLRRKTIPSQKPVEVPQNLPQQLVYMNEGGVARNWLGNTDWDASRRWSLHRRNLCLHTLNLHNQARITTSTYHIDFKLPAQQRKRTNLRRASIATIPGDIYRTRGPGHNCNLR